MIAFEVSRHSTNSEIVSSGIYHLILNVIIINIADTFVNCQFLGQYVNQNTYIVLNQFCL